MRMLLLLVKPPLAITSVSVVSCHLFVCLSVCRQNAKKRDFPKTKQFRAMVSIDILDLDANMPKRDFLKN